MTVENKFNIEISEEHKLQINQMNDKDVVNVWKVHYSRAKRFKQTQKEYWENKVIANYAAKVHDKNRAEYLLKIQERKEAMTVHPLK